MISAFLLGLLGSLHCFLMCGPLVATVGQKTRKSPISTALIYQLGRITVYCIFGAVVGMVGYGFSLYGLHQYVAVAVGSVLIFMALQEFLSLSLSIRSNPMTKLSFWLLQFKNKLKINSPFLMGMVNGLLPCGLVYIALTGALIYDTPQNSAIYMLWFGLGTCPVMLGCFLFPKLKLNQNFAFFPKLFPWAVFVMGLWIISRGLGLGIPYLSPDNNSLKVNTIGATQECIQVDDTAQKKLP